MINYFKEVLSIFEKPKISKDYESKRNAHPLELFFDLIFVAAMAKIAHLLHEPEIMELIAIFVLYITIYQIWHNITLYNIYYFGSSYFIKMFLFLGMLPIIFIIGLSEVLSIESIYIMSIAFIVSRLSLAFMWFVAIDKTNDEQYIHYMNREAKYHIITYVLSSVIAFLPLLGVNYFIISLIAALIVEFVVILIRNVDMVDIAYPFFNYELLKERQILFLIIIWGEGIVLITNSIANSIVSNRVSEGVILFVILFIYFIRTIEEYELTKINEKNINFYAISHFILVFSNLVLFISLGEVAVISEIGIMNKMMVLVPLGVITIWHIINNRMTFVSSIEYMEKYKRIDNICLSLQFILIIILFFIDENLIFLSVVLIYFILLIIATPYRYICIKEMKKIK